MLLFYLFIALSLSFLCSILEAVLLSTTPSYIQSLAKTNAKAARLLQNTKRDIEKSISAILTVNTFAHTIGAAGVGMQAAVVFGEGYMIAVSMVMTLLILYISEIIPKTIGATHWRGLAPKSALIIRVLVLITYPLNIFSSWLTRRIGKGDKERHAISRDEILAITELGERSGAVREKEVDLIENMLSLANFKVRDILTPRSVVFSLQKDTTVKAALQCEELFTRSRIPVFDSSIDDVVGMVFARRVMEEEIADRSDTPIEAVMVPIFRISENIPVLKLLDMFIHRKEHLFLVVDNYGQTAGIVTLEDAIEQLLDVDIMDEYDSIEDMQEFAKLKMKGRLRPAGDNGYAE
jgi:CBS domain containing-hemolysin-like protein